MNKPRVFVGSSKEALEIAEAFQSSMGPEYEGVIWNQFFLPGDMTLQTLVQRAEEFDFAVLVVTPDDLTISRGKRSTAPRDNILFELGLFMGVLGPQRTLILHPTGKNFKWPSDLAGVTTAEFSRHQSGNLEASLGGAVHRIKQAVSKVDSRERSVVSAEEVLAELIGTIRASDSEATRVVKQVLLDVIQRGLTYEESLKLQKWPGKKTAQAGLWLIGYKQLTAQLDTLVGRLREFQRKLRK